MYDLMLKSDIDGAFRVKCLISQGEQGARISQCDNVNHSKGGF